jgi:hypothetical protein
VYGRGAWEVIVSHLLLSSYGTQIQTQISNPGPYDSNMGPYFDPIILTNARFKDNRKNHANGTHAKWA